MVAPANNVWAQGQGSVTADQLNTFVQGTATQASLGSFTGTLGMTVFAQGASTPGDGGQGLYYWNPTATGSTNAPYLIKPSGAGTYGAWILMPLTVTNISPAAGIAFNNTGTIASSYAFPAYWLPFGFTINQAACGGYCTTASTADYTLSIFNYGTQIGTVTFHAGTKNPSFNFTAPVLAAQSRIYLGAPYTTDATLAGISVTLAPQLGT